MEKTPGALLAAQRKKVSSHCKRCGSPMHGLTTKKHCSNACRQAAHRARQQLIN